MSCKHCGMPPGGDDVGPACCYPAQIDAMRGSIQRLERQLDAALREREEARASRDALAGALAILEQFRTDDLSFAGMQQDEGDCWTAPIIAANRYLRQAALGGEAAP